MVRIRSGIAVTGLVAASLVTLGVFTVQAAHAPLRIPPAQAAAAAARRGPEGLPADSGRGQRVVYSVGQRRVWLVDRHGRVTRTYRVLAGDVAPSLGTHRVFARRSHGQGGDGRNIEHVVMFATRGDDNVGFSAVVRPPAKPSTPHQLRAAIRASREDGDALWNQAIIGTLVQVVP